MNIYRPIPLESERAGNYLSL